MATEPDLSDILLRTFLARRDLLREGPAARAIAIVGSELSAESLTSKNSFPPPCCHTMRLVSPGAFPLTRISLGPTAVASATSPKPTETRSIGSALFTTMDFPTVTRRSLGDSSTDA